jgi:ADP-ribosyl-[dinitrogen reductase] hydrolase
MSDSELHDRALGAYLGLAIGDALGAPVEFMTAREIAHRYGTFRDMTGGGWLRLAAGQVTDDTTMSLALGDALVACGGFQLRAVADAFVRWLRSKPVDCGNACRRGLQRYIADGSLAGVSNEADGGNGAVMRNLPVALATLGSDAAFARQTLGQCHITHNHPLSDAAALALGRMTQVLVQGGGASACRSIADQLVVEHPQFRFARYPGRASGYVVDTVQTVLHHFFEYEDFEACLVAVVNRGEDADTNAALAGMLAGARCGARRLPRRWLRALDPAIRRQIRIQTAALLGLGRKPSSAVVPHGLRPAVQG